ncbi:MAG TPA: hypothetical protein VMI72_00885 [Roseiarcus sp.]|nr:hypothetical protein [Roseiarcus sp.]
MDRRVDPKTASRRKRNNWLLLVALLIVAAFMYAIIVFKVTHYGVAAPP